MKLPTRFFMRPMTRPLMRVLPLLWNRKACAAGRKPPGNSAIYIEYLKNYRRQQQFVRLVFEHRQQLEILYQTDLTPLQKRTKKASIFADMRNEFRHLKTTQTGLEAYDAWMNQPLNNAKIGGVVAYHDFVPAFSVILADNNGDLTRFYETCRQLAQKKKDERHRILRAAMQRVPETARQGFTHSNLTNKLNFFNMLQLCTKIFSVSAKSHLNWYRIQPTCF